MSHPSRNKGNRAETEAARILADLTGWPVRRKLGAGRADDAGDLDGVPDTCIEVKRYRGIAAAVSACMADLERERVNAGATFAAGMCRGDRGDWVVVMSPEHFAAFVKGVNSQ